MKYYRKIVGERVYLSPLSIDDADTYIKWMNDEAVAANFGTYHRAVSSKNDLKWLYEPDDDTQRYAIALIDGDILIGVISIQNVNHLNRNAFVGLFIGDAERRGRGYGAEAMRLILNYGFKTLNLHSIALTVHADNRAGLACYAKVGFREVGRLPECVFKDGKYVDKLYMCILEGEFNGSPAADN